jgi:hypothetical protein
LVQPIQTSDAIDTLASLIGNEKILYAMADEPEKIKEARDILWQSWVTIFHNDALDIMQSCNGGGNISLEVWAPGCLGTFQCDLCVMISTDMFDEFVFSDLKTAYAQVDYGIYHLDGEGEIKHLDSLFRLEKLRMIQWVPSQRLNDPYYTDPLNWIDLIKRIQNTGRSVLLNTPYNRVKDLLNKIDRDLTYLVVNCPDVETAYQVLRDLENNRSISVYDR